MCKNMVIYTFWGEYMGVCLHAVYELSALK